MHVQLNTVNNEVLSTLFQNEITCFKNQFLKRISLVNKFNKDEASLQITDLYL